MRLTHHVGAGYPPGPGGAKARSGVEVAYIGAGRAEFARPARTAAARAEKPLVLDTENYRVAQRGRFSRRSTSRGYILASGELTGTHRDSAVHVALTRKWVFGDFSDALFFAVHD